MIKNKKILTNKFGYTTVITDAGNQWLNNSSKNLLKLRPIEQMYQYLKRKNIVTQPLYNLSEYSLKANEITGTVSKLLSSNTTIKTNNTNNDIDNQKLINDLMFKRKKLAGKFDVMPYMIASNQAIQQFAELKPLTLEDISRANIDGFSSTKIIKFGNDFLECILQNQLSSITSIPNTNDAANKSKATMFELLQKYPIINGKCNDKQLIHIIVMLENNKSIAEILQTVNINPSILISYISDGIKYGFNITQKHLEKLQITKQIFMQIKAILPKENLMDIRFATLKEQLPINITYDMIKLVLNYNQVREHLNKLQLNYYDPDENVLEEKKTEIISTINGKSISSQKEILSYQLNFSSNTTEKDDLWGSDEDVFMNDLLDKTSTRTVNTKNENDNTCLNKISNDNNSDNEIIGSILDIETEMLSEMSNNKINITKTTIVDEKRKIDNVKEDLSIHITNINTIPCIKQTVIVKPSNRIIYNVSDDADDKMINDNAVENNVTINKRTLPNWFVTQTIKNNTCSNKLSNHTTTGIKRKKNNLF